MDFTFLPMESKVTSFTWGCIYLNICFFNFFTLSVLWESTQYFSVKINSTHPSLQGSTPDWQGSGPGSNPPTFTVKTMDECVLSQLYTD